jgi:hypothetical protein
VSLGERLLAEVNAQLDARGLIHGDEAGMVVAGDEAHAAALGRALAGLRADTAPALDAHGEARQRGERRGHAFGAGFDQLFHRIVDDLVVLACIWFSLAKDRAGMEPRRGRTCRTPPSRAHPHAIQT